MKRPLRVILRLLLLAAPPAAQAQLNYTTNAGSITITGYSGPVGGVTIPETINNLPVTSIGGFAFTGVPLTSATIPGSVTNMDYAFFKSPLLASATIANGLTSIGDYTFFACSSLTNVTIPASMANIGYNAFAYSSLASATITAGITNIGDGAFLECQGLTEISVDPANMYYCSPDGVLLNKSQTTLIQYPNGRVGGYAIPGSVTDIKINALEYSIYLTSAAIPAAVSNIESGALLGCDNLTNISVDPANAFYCSVNGALLDKSKTTIIQCPGAATAYAIPAGVTSIGHDSFEYCSSLTNITIPAGITNIGNYAFNYCPRLMRVTIPGSVTNIGEFAFSSCSSLAGIYFYGDAPAADSTVFTYGNSSPSAYYLPGASGWSSTFAGLPAVLWNPAIQNNDTSFGFRGNSFGFDITGTSNLVVALEACPNLAAPAWSPLRTITLTNGLFYFSEPVQTNVSTRYCRMRFP